MRFLILTQYYDPEVGAAQVRLGALTRQLIRLGHDVEVVTALPSYPEGRIRKGYRGRPGMVGRRSGARVYRTFILPATGRGTKRLLGYLSFTFSATAGVLAAKKPDVVFVESPPPTLAIPGWLASRFRGARLVLNVADLWPDSATSLGLATPGLLVTAAQLLERWAYKRADFITATTEGIRRVLITHKGVAEDRILFLANGVDTHLFHPASYDAELADEVGVRDRRVVMLAGSLGYGAGLDVIVRAAELARDQPITFLIVGGGSEFDRLAETIASEQLSNVLLLGPKPLAEVAALYAIADIGLMTLVDSPFFAGTRPARIYPAMAAGKPIVYSGAGEGASLIQEARAGLIVPPADAEALLQAVNRLLSDKELASEMGRSGRDYVERTLTWDHLVEQWLHELEGQLAGQR